MFRAVSELLTTRPRGSVLILTDFKSFDRCAIRIMKETVVFDKLYAKKFAWVGTENFPHVFSANLGSFSRRDFPLFKISTVTLRVSSRNRR
jgi:hypothetical protein